MEYLFASEMDEELMEHKKDFIASLHYVKSADDLNLFHLMNKEFLLTPVDKLPVHDSLYSQDLFDSTELKMIPHRILRTGITVKGQQYELVIMESIVSDIELIGAIMGIQMIMLILLLIGSVLINRKLSSTIWNPFYHILDRLKKYNIDQDPALDLPRSSTAEFRELNAVISQLVERNHESYLDQKEFTENASHEMQTPLAICRTKLELLAQTKELTEEQAELVESLLEATDRLTRLNKNLLLLSRIENRLFQDTEQLSLKRTSLKCLDTFADVIKEKKLEVLMEVDEQARISINATLLETLINNMLSNAVRHSPDQSKIVIEGSQNFFKVINQGEPLKNPEKIFQRFHRESRTPYGSGLGLSIVKKICDVSGFHITYEYDANQHRFIVRF
jgi:signal transduction histidine kinase